VGFGGNHPLHPNLVIEVRAIEAQRRADVRSIPVSERESNSVSRQRPVP